MSCFFPYMICCNILPVAIVKEDGLGLNNKIFERSAGKQAWRPDAHAFQMLLFPELAYNAFQIYSHTHVSTCKRCLVKILHTKLAFFEVQFPSKGKQTYVCVWSHDWSWHGLERPRNKSIFIHIALWVAYGQLLSLNSIYLTELMPWR